MDTKRWIAIILSITVFLFSFLISATAGLIRSMSSDSSFFGDIFGTASPRGEILRDGDFTSRIAVLEVRGIITETQATIFDTPGYNHSAFMNALDSIKNDSSVDGIILAVSTPGGGVYESARIRDKLNEIRDERDIPIYVSMGSVAASGGYYISAEADRIFAGAETLTGSIGVIMSGLNFAQLLEDFGIYDTTIKSGELKDIGSPFRPVNEEEIQVLQEMIDDSYERFINIVQNGRNLGSRELELISDGRILDGARALEAGLVDELGYFEDVIEAMSNDFDLHDSQVYKYNTSGTAFLSPFSFRMHSLAERFLPSSLLPRDKTTDYGYPRLMYIMGG